MSVADQVESGRVAAMRSVSSRGLCIACRKDPVCNYPRNDSRPVLQCEEFEGYEPRTKSGEDPEESAAHGLSSDQHSPELKGLCISCANRLTCGFPRQAGGVWHCEEFR